MSEPGAAIALHREMERIYGSPSGWRALKAVNHTTIGLRFIITAFVFFLIGGVLAMLIRAQLAAPHAAWLDAPSYAQVFTMHGVLMMFLFAIPLIEGFALYMLPKILGARDLAFPRLSAFGYYCYVFGGAILLIALLSGMAPDSGWFMYTPLSSQPYSPGINADIWLIGVTFVEVSAVCAAVEFMATVLKVRAAGMSLDRMPILAWYLWVTAAMMLFGFPPLILGSVLLEVERAFGWPFFDPTRGGDPLLWQHLFWLFGHPEVYIIFLPGAGIISTLLPVFCGRPLVGYVWVVAAIIALGFISFGLWVHHMFATGIPHLSLAFFSAASLLVVIPTAIQIFAWLATLLTGRPRLTLPMLYVYGFFAVFVLGGLTGVMVAVIPFDLQAHDTHFIVAHLHYVLIGGFVFPVLAGLYYWLPHATGRTHVENLGHAAFWFIFVGVNITFLPMHLTGLLGMPRRVHTYDEVMGWDTLNLISSMGGFMLAIGFALVLIDIIHHARFAPLSQRNPWKAGSLEWAMPTPPPAYNFASLPVVASREPAHDDPALPATLAGGGGLLCAPRHGWRETLGVRPLDGAPDQVILLPGPSWSPLLTAAACAVFFVSFLFKIYAFALLGLGAVVVSTWLWLWDSGSREDTGAVEIGDGARVPLQAEASDPPTLWGMVFTLMANGVFFGALVFGYLYLWVIAPNWPPPAMIPPVWVSPLAALLASGGAWLSALRARAAVKTGSSHGLAWLGGCTLLSVVAALAVATPLLWLAPAPASHAYAAVVHALALYAVFQAGVGALIATYAAARTLSGYVSAARSVEFSALALWQSYTAAAVLIIVALIHLPAWNLFA